MELCLYVFSIIFVWVFHDRCLCPFLWQWQLGIVAVFLAWINLMIFFSKFPLTGVYVLMFTTICRTFLKILVLSLLLVIAFALTFFLIFHEPSVIMVGKGCHWVCFVVCMCARMWVLMSTYNICGCAYVCVSFINCVCVKHDTLVIQPSPFSSPASSLLKITSMTAGDFSFNTIFGLESDGMISFPAISYIVWILFIVVMPILFTNMLVSEDISWSIVPLLASYIGNPHSRVRASPCTKFQGFTIATYVL